MDSGDRGMNVVAMTIINPQNKKKMAEPGIKPATSCSQILYVTDRAMLWQIEEFSLIEKCFNYFQCRDLLNNI